MRLDERSKAVEGNAAVVQLFEHWLAIAKEGKIRRAALVVSRGPTDYAISKAGALGMEFAICYGLAELDRATREELMSRQIKHVNTAATADRVQYNLAKMCSSFDFVGWLLDAEMTRVRESAPFPLKVHWFLGQDGKALLDSVTRQINFEGILRPMLKLVGAVEDKMSAHGRVKESCTLIPVVEAYKRGEKLPTFNAPIEAREALKEVVAKEFGQPPVVITLREAKHFPHRNSNMTEWLKFAEWLEQRGEKVVFVRDTAKAQETIAGFRTCPAASEDLLVRMALYQEARMNFFVANGPAMLAVFSDAPWCIVNQVQDDGGYRANTTEGWYGCTGITPPEQWPWCREDQRIVWELDTFENLCAAWESFGLPRMDEAQAEAAE